MIGRPPRSTLSPYTTLSRSQVTRHEDARPTGSDSAHGAEASTGHRWIQAERAVALRDRSEEHTSELQSRQYLVCRLLLEKKSEERDRKNTRLKPSDANIS